MFTWVDIGFDLVKHRTQGHQAVYRTVGDGKDRPKSLIVKFLFMKIRHKYTHM